MPMKGCRADDLPGRSQKYRRVLSVERVRLRRAGKRLFVDATVSVAALRISRQVTHSPDRIERVSRKSFPTERDVHARTPAPSDENLFESVRGFRSPPRMVVTTSPPSQQDGHLSRRTPPQVDAKLSLRAKPTARRTEIEDGHP